MCTAVKYVSGDTYFGRTLDNDCGYGEELVITPRRRVLTYKHLPACPAHYAFMGVATVMDGEAMYYDGFNEKGLAAAGLNFVGNAAYFAPVQNKHNVTPYEFIPWLLSSFASVAEVRKALKDTVLAKTPFSSSVPLAELHWMIADKSDCIAVESVADGLKVYDDPAGILTNNPSFPEHMCHLSNYMCLSPRPPRNEFSDKIKMNVYSRGMGAIGLPGDLSSASRFVRAAFTALNSPCCTDNAAAVNQFFHILENVSMPRGCCLLDNGEYEITVYASCCNITRGVYYYMGYDNHRICAVDLNKVNLEGSALFRYPFVRGEQFYAQN